MVFFELDWTGDGESENYQGSTAGTPLSCDVDELSHGVYSTASVSTNYAELSSETLIFQATLDNENWTGKVNAYTLKTE